MAAINKVAVFDNGENKMIEFRKTDDNYKEVITYKCHDHLSLNEMMQEFRYFLLALGYHPESVENHIEAE